jgi:hypothetical protein
MRRVGGLAISFGIRSALAVGVVSTLLIGCGGGNSTSSSSVATSTSHHSAAVARTAEPVQSPPEPPPPPTAPTAGTNVVTVTAEGVPSIIGGGDEGFAILDSNPSFEGGTDESTLTAYDVAGGELGRVGPGTFDGRCGAEEVSVPGQGATLLTYQLGEKPAEGIVEPKLWTELTAWEANTGRRLWSTSSSTANGPGAQEKKKAWNESGRRSTGVGPWPSHRSSPAATWLIR